MNTIAFQVSDYLESQLRHCGKKLSSEDFDRFYDLVKDFIEPCMYNGDEETI
jgi:hypothetical protein